jgi:hypothetical protein
MIQHLSLTLLCVIIAIVIVADTNNNEKNRFDEKLNKNNIFYQKTIKKIYTPSLPIPIPYKNNYSD